MADQHVQFHKSIISPPIFLPSLPTLMSPLPSLQAMRTPSRNEAGLELLMEYYNQLYFFDSRFFPPTKSLGVYFHWLVQVSPSPLGNCEWGGSWDQASMVGLLPLQQSQGWWTRGGGFAVAMGELIRGCRGKNAPCGDEL